MLNRLPPRPYTPRQVLGALVVLLVLVALGVTLCVRPTPQTGSCTHTIGPGDNGVQAWLASAQPGQTLCLRPGTYTGSANMLSIPSTFAGTEAQPIVIRAETEGTVLLDGEDTRRPVHLRGAWGVLWGVNVTRGDNNNVAIHGTHWKVQRLLSWDVGTHTDHNIVMGGTANLLEDFGAWGTAEKQVTAGTGNQTATGNVLRRGWVRWEDAGDSTSPTNAAELGYGQSKVVFENLIGTWNRTGTRSQPEGVYEMFRSNNSKFLGSIAYIRAGSVYDAPSHLFFAISDAGSAAGQGNYAPARDNTLAYLVSYVEPTHAEFAQMRAFSFAYDPPGPHGERNTVQHLVSVSGLPISCQAPDWSCSSTQHGTSLADALGTGKSVWLDSVAAPGVCRRYVNGTLTDQGLWPWPMNQRIIDAMGKAGYEPVDVTRTMEELFGPIPQQCRTDGAAPIPPEPGPPGPHVTLACSGTLQAIPGPINLVCQPQTKKR